MDVSALVIDSDPQSAAAMCQALRDLDLPTEQVTTLEQALDANDAAPVDLLVVNAEAFAGADASLARLTTSVSENGPGVLLYTEDVAKLTTLLSLVSYDYFLPPFDPGLLRVRIDSVLERKRVRLLEERDAKRTELLKLERDVQIGREIQLGFLPTTLPQPDGWEITACFHPAREVAGDFYDAFYMVNKRRVGFVIADVCDKGVGAALFMALFRTLVRSNAQNNTSLSWIDPGSGSITENRDWLKGDPNQRRQSLPNIGTGALMNAVAGANDYITENHMEQGYFATMFMGVLDPGNGSLVYINGGHNPPTIIRSDGVQEFLKPTGPAVGMLPGVRYKMGHTRLGPGDILYAYTDGVTDARSAEGDFFTEQRLFSVVAEGAPSAQALVSDIEAQLKAHIGGAAQFDDITMIALRRAPDQE